MPTYGYKCTACAYEYEKREGFDAPAKQKCPKCKKQATRMLFAPAMVFKGSGFYKTDSRGSDTSSETSAPSSPDASSADASAPAEKPAADAGHGHSHGPGGHSHGPKAEPATTPAKSTPTTTEAAAAS